MADEKESQDKKSKKEEQKQKDQKEQKVQKDIQPEVRDAIKKELREELKLEIKDNIITNDLIKEREKLLKGEKKGPNPLVIIFVSIVAIVVLIAAVYFLLPKVGTNSPDGIAKSSPTPKVALASCVDGKLNQNEQGVDCGGVCKPCETCTDGTKNRDETALDCGGSFCPKCQNSQSCLKDSDCISNNCFDSICKAASCSDSKINQGETGPDCGGPCPPCVSCDNGIKDGTELGIDCGGSCPKACSESYDMYPEDKEWLTENFQKGSMSMLRRNAVPNGLKVGESYVFALALSNIYQDPEDFKITITYVRAKDFSSNNIQATREVIEKWIVQKETAISGVPRYEIRYLPVPIKVGDMVSAESSTVPGFYTFKINIFYRSYADTFREYDSKEFTVKVIA